jgi:glycosyltransferase involved in cell wall biosynthesis
MKAHSGDFGEMRIVYLNPSGQLGGAEASLLNVLASLRVAEPDWSLRLIVVENGPLVARANALGVPTTVLPFPSALARLGETTVADHGGNRVSRPVLLLKLLSAGWAAATYTRQLRRVLRELAPDVIHTNGLKMHVLGVRSRPRRIPVIWHIHDYVHSRPISARLLRRYAAQCAAVVANSKSVADDVQSTCGDRVKVYHVPNAVDLAVFSPAGPALDLDALAGLPRAGPATVKVGLVGTLGIWKGHKIFLEALSLLPSGLPIRGYVVGDALYQTDGSQYTMKELRGLAAQLGISHRVGFTGFVEDPAAAMRALDIVVHASTAPEPFGLVIAEAMACGRAVIASEAGGAREIMTPGTNALGHPPGDAATLAERIIQLATDADLRAELGREGRATAERRFNRERLATDLVPIDREVTSLAN